MATTSDVPRYGCSALCFGFLLLACHGNSEEVSTDVCVSGRRWIGDDSNDEEMRPGSECLDCHLKKDGPPLVAAGTVYGVLDNAEQIERDCYGLEGVEVEVEGADGHVWKTTTNRAGNFYFDGEPAWLVKPYVARFRYTTADGKMVEPQMVQTMPSYGGCAHCHDGRAEATPELLPGDPDFVLPVKGLFAE